jgi:uncharacterized damage-inducible protein DinB
VLDFAAVNLRELLLTPTEYLAAEKTLEGLSGADAERRVAGAPHSVAEIVGHLAFWQEWFYARCVGEAAAMVSSAAMGWPEVAEGSWEMVRARFLDRLVQVAALGDGDVSRRLSPAIEFPPLANYTVGDALAHVGTHNAHHLGQIILLRQLMGAWPPPAGSWTW